MSENAKLQFCKGDVLAIAVVILLAVTVLLCFLPNRDNPSGQAAIYLNGALLKTVDLTKNQTFSVSDRYHNVIRVENGHVAIIESNCPGKDCVHSGSIHDAGRILVCLPNALEIRIISDQSDVDFVVR